MISAEYLSALAGLVGFELTARTPTSLVAWRLPYRLPVLPEIGFRTALLCYLDVTEQMIGQLSISFTHLPFELCQHELPFKYLHNCCRYREVLTINPDVAEVLGLLLGDGCLCRFVSRGRDNYQVAFTASEFEYGYYESFVKPTIESNFQVSGRLYHRSDNTTRYHLYSKRLALQLIGLGIPVGRKRDAAIPEAVLKGGQAVPFIRGLYHAEGSLYRRYSKRYNRHVRVYDRLRVIQIRTKLETLMNQLRNELLKLGISPNRLTGKDGVFTLRITDQKEIDKFIAIVQPRYKSCLTQASL
jgi:hypothetical protein